MRRVFFLAAIVCGLLVRGSEAAELRINYSELATLLRVALRDAEVHLNNKPNTGLLALVGPKQSYVKIGSTEIPIVVPPHVVLGTNYYVNQIDSTKITVAPLKQAVRVTVKFQAEGPAIVASSSAVPWVQWRDAAIDIDFKPIRAAKGVSFEVTRVSMQGPFFAFCPSGDGFASVACDFLALGATKQQMTRVRAKVETALMGHLNTPQLREQFADVVTKYLSFANTGDVDIRLRDVKPVAEGIVVTFCINNCS